MASSSQIKIDCAAAAEPTLAKTLAPEEIRPGDFVTPLFVVAEVPTYFWRMDAWDQPPEEPVRMRFMPSTQGSPLKVRSVCLPFVLVKSPNGEHASLDLRTCQLARLDKTHARCVWKAFKNAAQKSRGNGATNLA